MILIPKRHFGVTENEDIFTLPEDFHLAENWICILMALVNLLETDLLIQSKYKNRKKNCVVKKFGRSVKGNVLNNKLKFLADGGGVSGRHLKGSFSSLS